MGLGFKMWIVRVLRRRIKRRTICFYLDLVVGDVTSVGVVGGVVIGIGAVVGSVGVSILYIYHIYIIYISYIYAGHIGFGAVSIIEKLFR